MVFVSLCCASFMSALDVTIVTTALPTITRDIGGEDKYVWIANSYTITQTAIQPFFGQLSNIFGRRYVTIAAIIIFLLGSGLSGGAINVGMLIVGRCIQGLGAGALMMLLDLIICDMVPLRDRAKYVGIVMSSSAVSAALGPLIGGAIVQTISWRWTFYINLPIGGLVLIAIILFLKTKYKRSPTWMQALARIDYLGNAIFISSIISLLLGLIMGGQVFPWSSWRIILPIVLGVVGLGLFVFYESTSLCKEPTIPLELFGNRTSASAYAITFLSAMLIQWATYYLPIYFQGVQLSSPIRAGIQILPLNTCIIPFTMVAGIIVSNTGKYIHLHFTSFALIALSFGLFSRLDQYSSTAEWVLLQIVAAAGLGFTLNSPLTALQASLPDSYSASATATYAFLRSFAFVWGITIPAIIFNAQVANNAFRITADPELQSALGSGAALGYTTRQFLMSLASDTRDQVVNIFTDAFQITWYISLAFSLLGFILCFGEKQLELRTTLDTEFGLDEKKKGDENNNKTENGTITA
ncbi:MFS general substrate transporter [Hypoxylon sp. NC0597]|nr:MFS general substrate transporter [Hypoxylon sp. NC0597]